MPLRRPVVMSFALWLVLLTGQARAADDCYVNARFGFELCFPAGSLVGQGESENGDGQRFLSPDGQIELLAWGGHNALDQTLAQAFAEAKAASGLKATYTACKHDWFVVSGIAGQNILYRKTWLLSLGAQSARGPAARGRGPELPRSWALIRFRFFDV